MRPWGPRHLQHSLTLLHTTLPIKPTNQYYLTTCYLIYNVTYHQSADQTLDNMRLCFADIEITVAAELVRLKPLHMILWPHETLDT